MALHRSQIRRQPIAVCWAEANPLSAARMFWLSVVVVGLIWLGPLTGKAVEIDVPSVSPQFRIRVSGDTFAHEVRGKYDVLAFEGSCELNQGGFTATADEIVLWIENEPSRHIDLPGKIICYLEGDARLDWGDGQSLRDHRWTGRLFSLHPVDCKYQRQIRRYDIPNLVWDREPSGQVQFAAAQQFSGASGAGQPVESAEGKQFSGERQADYTFTPPPLLDAVNEGMVTRGGNAPVRSYTGGQTLPGQSMAGPNSTGQLPSSDQAPANSGRFPTRTLPAVGGEQVGSDASTRGELAPPDLPGAISWEQPGSEPGSSFPRGGLAVPPSGGSPYPAAQAMRAGSQIAEDIGQPQLPNANVSESLPPPNLTQSQRPAQLPAPTQQVVRQPPLVTPEPSLGAKSVQFLARDSTPPRITFQPNPTSGETIGQISGGFKLIVEGIKVPQADGSVVDYGTVTLEADNAVVWVRADGPVDIFNGFESTPDRPLELYLDGNIVFYQGNRVIYADRMYYNVSSEYGMVLNAEVLTPAPQFQGLLRLKADVLQQRSSRSFMAYGAAVTSSRLGVPRYWLQSNEISFEDNRPQSDLSVFAPLDSPRETNMKATARSNFVYLAGVPIGFWPQFETNLAEPSFYLSSIQFGNDSIFGTQVYTEWNLYQLLGMEPIEGTDLKLSLDYLSERGPAIGGHWSYARPTLLFGALGTGSSDVWFIDDSGLDFLGLDRAGLTPEDNFRGRTRSKNRIFFSQNLELQVQGGWISDRNFLEQYFENEWDQNEDSLTQLRLRRYNGSRMLDVTAGARINEFFTETERLPQIDHYWLGQDLFGERFTWNAHSRVGYVHQRVAEAPTDPIEAAKFTSLPWESDSEGLVASTRQELSLPLDLGAWKVVPFISGEAAFWNEDVNQDDLTRLTGQTGVRTALPMSRIYPNVQNRLLDIRGIAHKVTLQSEFFYADSNENLERLPLFDPLDDNSQEHFRRRFIFNTFGGALPQEFDERFFALRSGMQRWVTAGSPQIADDLMQARFGINQRWQTKRGLPGRERVVDVVSLNAGFTLFPKPERDNFGEDVGAFNYDLRYHVGDRLTLLSDGYFDVFSQGLKSISAGARISRPGRGDAYLGILSLEGPISANIVNGFVNYRMNDKWILSSGAAFDFGATGNIGQNIALTRIGETALVRMGVNIDHGRDNVSFNFNIEPRFLPIFGLGQLGGELIPPVGARGLE